MLLPEDFKHKTLADALKVNSIEFKNIGEKIREKIPKMPFGLGPAQKEKDGDFDNILEFIPDVHGVLPYASESTSLAPRHFSHKRPLPDFTRSIPSTPRRPHYSCKVKLHTSLPVLPRSVTNVQEPQIHCRG